MKPIDARRWIDRAREMAPIAVSAAILLGYAIYNGYPLVWSDTSAYLWSGWTHVVPKDRPITYGLFLRLTSLGITLWLPIAIQALLTAWAIRFSLGPIVAAWVTPAVTTFLALTTGLSPHAGLVLPDIFSGLAVLALARLLTAASLTRSQGIGLGALLVLSLAVHLSHLFIAVVLVAAAVGLTLAAPGAAARAGLTRGRSLGVAALVTASGLAVPSLHRLLGGGFSWSRFSHVFLMGRMAETGILGAFLDEACPTRHYRLCDYRAALPLEAWRFIWERDSPMALTGGAAANRAEYREIIGATLSRPRFLAMHLGKAIEGTAQQLVRFQMPTLPPYGPGIPPYNGVRYLLPRELPSYQRARQMQGLRFEGINAVQPWMVLLSFIAIGAVLSAERLRRRTPGFMTGWTVAVLLGVILNAAICGALSSPTDRYAARIIWTIPLAAIALFMTIRHGSRDRDAVPVNGLEG